MPLHIGHKEAMQVMMLFDAPGEFYPVVTQDFLVMVYSPTEKCEKLNLPTI